MMKCAYYSNQPLYLTPEVAHIYISKFKCFFLLYHCGEDALPPRVIYIMYIYICVCVHTDSVICPHPTCFS